MHSLVQNTWALFLLIFFTHLFNILLISNFCGLLFDSVLLRESVLSYCLKGQLEMIYYFIETQFMGRSYFIAFRNNLKQIDGKVLNFCQIGERIKMPRDNLEDCIIWAQQESAVKLWKVIKIIWHKKPFTFWFILIQRHQPLTFLLLPQEIKRIYNFSY